MCAYGAHCVRIVMSKATKTPTGKRGRPRVKITKARQTITMEPAVLNAARKMAANDGLALSTWLNQLVRERAVTIHTGAAQ